MTLEELAEQVHAVKNVLWWRDRPVVQSEMVFLLEDALIALQACACEFERMRQEDHDN